MTEEDGRPWHFTRETNAKGHTYIYAYQTAWDPVRKRSRRVAKQYAGRLADDGRVLLSSRFIERMPEYAKGNFYYGEDKTLVDERTWRLEFPEKAAPQESDEEGLRTRSVGAVWTLEQLTLEAGVPDDLCVRLKPADARKLLHLAIYRLEGGTSSAAFGDWLEDARSGEPVRALLAKVSREDADAFFALRRKRLQNSRNLLAFDVAAPAGRSMVPLRALFACDPETGEIVFAHASEGEVPDETALNEAFFHMNHAGLATSDAVLVTELGGFQELCPELKFVQAVSLSDDIARERLDAERPFLRSLEAYDSGLDVYARTVPCAGGAFLHFFRFPGVDEAAQTLAVKKADEILACRAKGLPAPPDLWRTHGRFVRETGPGQWQRENDAIEHACRDAGILALRTNAFADPLEALAAWRLRRTLEADFERFSLWTDEDPLRRTGRTAAGECFAAVLAASIRQMMMKRIEKRRREDPALPDLAPERLLARLRSVRADKRPKAAAWVLRPLTRRQRDLFSLLGLAPPPRVLHREA